MWDNSWDEITNQDYLNVPYDDWNKGDIFDIRSNMKKISFQGEHGAYSETSARRFFKNDTGVF